MRDFDVVGATLPAVTAAASGHVGAPLSAARQELAVLNAQLEAASQALAAANEPVARLYGLIGDVQRAEQDLIARRNRHDGEIGQWIASGCRGERPFADPDLVAAERTLGEAAENARAARSALPAL